jgi:5S rRNA maturation endonuclease (ribonuclease M5)
MISKDDILLATEQGKAVIAYYYPQSSSCFVEGAHKNFKIREDDKHPSCAVFKDTKGIWMIQDKGGADNKARTCFQLVMENEHLTFPQAIDWIAAKFAPELLEKDRAGWVPSTKPMPTIEKAAPHDDYEVGKRPGLKFTDKELAQLGYKITPELCADLCLIPLDYYITKKNAKGQSYKIASNESYPIYYYDYGSYGKIYQPLGEVRFLWVGQKPTNLLSGEKEFMARMDAVKAHTWSATKIVKSVDDDGHEQEEQEDISWDKLIICSGPSDALNVHNAGYHVCWPNSETAELKEYDFRQLKEIAKDIYLLYDIDDTGMASMKKIGLSYLDVKLIILPAELKQLKTRKGTPCKDAKDFFVYYRKPETQDPVKLFDELVKLSGSLKFWSVKYTKDGKVSGYDINNEQLYAFLQASGFYKIATSTNKQGYTFCRIVDNVVTLIDEDAISAAVSDYLLDYLHTHPQYYSQALANAIHRSKQISKASLDKLKMIEPNFKAFDKGSDYFFFTNGIFRVSAEGITKVKTSECPYMVYSSKIIQHDFRPEDPYFDICQSDAYASKIAQLASTPPDTPNYYAIKKQVDLMGEESRWKLKIKRNDCSFMQFVYDTGRNYWRKEEAGYSLTEEEKAETDLNFISKSLALGYMLSKYKNAGQPYAVYAMEMEQSDEGEHLGGTGKSLFFNSIEQMRKQVYIDAQMMEDDKMQFMLQGVERGVTDTVFMDDLNNRINLHRFMNLITGKMVVNVKHAPAFTLDYCDSPKIAFTSNHAIRDFDDSLNRRIWFAAFSDYYHSNSVMRKLKERSPYTKFKKNLIQDYTPEEMNHFYNFMMNCIQQWKKIGIRIQPPMQKIMQRTLQKMMGDDFLWWAEDYFDEGNLNCLVDKQKALDAYKITLSKTAGDLIKAQTFKSKLQAYCQYKGYVFNPEQLLRTPTERKRCDIRLKVNGEDRYYFYIDTTKSADLPVEAILGMIDPQQLSQNQDQPPF